MENENHIVAFIDILGFKSHVESYLNGDKEILDKINHAFEDALNSPYMPIFEKLGLKIHYKQFSDCISLAFLDISSGNLKVDTILLCGFIHFLRSINVNMLLIDLYLRGGLSVGFHHENENMIFSEGLIKAYELELKAVYPRIIIDAVLVDRFRMLWETQKDTISLFGVDKILISDWDSTIFINPFNYSQSIESMISEGITPKPQFWDDKKDLKMNLIDIDNNFQIRILSNLENKIGNYESVEGYGDVLRKYIWLKELVKWNIDSESSKIKFEYFLK